MNFQEFCNQSADLDGQEVNTKDTFVIQFGQPGGSSFNIDPILIIEFLRFFLENFDQCKKIIETHELFKAPYFRYQEKPYRALYKFTKDQEQLNAISSLGGSQSSQLTKIISKLICFLSGKQYTDIKENAYFDNESISLALQNVPSDMRLLVSENRSSDDSSERKLAFKNWLISSGLSVTTAGSYSGTSINTADKILFKGVDAGKTLYDISSLEQIKSYLDTLDNNDEWRGKNNAGNNMYSSGTKAYLQFVESVNFASSATLSKTILPKPFLLLAGISGTGKTRFIREQANSDKSNYQLIPVRPDWHEPSDLLGYVSRLGDNGPNFIVTDTLKFIVKAWLATVDTNAASSGQLKPVNQIPPYWLCLDEMNLAPVEQYFADYLAILETRSWQDGEYSCDALIKLDALATQIGDNGMAILREHLGLAENDLWDYFSVQGIPLPPNLIVAGTVNMDETTHGFSRKVIDRAFTIDFGEFFPNDYSEYFSPSTEPVNLGFPILSHPTKDDLTAIAADPGGLLSLQFLQDINTVLADTPFQLAYRALNELFLALASFNPETDNELKAVWDDFMMSKVLPRIDGDAEKLSAKEDIAPGENLLEQLASVLEGQFADIWNSNRLDILRKNRDASELLVPCRSSKKLRWMQDRLANSGFTSFWP